MASIGLKIQDNRDVGASLGLADILAKSIFGDPEGEINARVKAAEVGARMAYRDKQLADAGLVGVKTKQEQDILDAERAAGPLVGNAAAAAVPMPVPVEVSRANAPGTTGYGPQPLDRPKLDADQTRYNALVAQEHALGRILVHGNPEQVASGVNKNYGGAILSGATINPAIVNPDSLRLASTLYTGSAPTTSTVLTSGDYAGVDAEARGKILQDRAKPPEPKMFGDKPYLINPDGSLLPAQGFQPTPKDPNVVDLPNGGKGVLSRDAQGNPIVTPLQGAGPVPKLVPVTPDTMVQNPDGTLTTPKTDRPAVVAGPFADLNSPEGRALDTISKVQTKLADAPETLNPQDARDYGTAFNLLYAPKPTSVLDANGVPRWSLTPGAEVPSGVPHPSIVNARVRAAAPVVNGQPVQAEPPVAVPPRPKVGEPVFPDVGKIPVGEAGKAVAYANSMATAEPALSAMTPADIPSGLQTYLATNNGGGLLQQAIVNSGTDEQTRLWAIPMLEFVNAVNRKQSGAAILPDEWATARQRYIPLPNDTPAVLEDKRRNRINDIGNFAAEGWGANLEGLANFKKEWEGRGVRIELQPLLPVRGPASVNIPPEIAAAGLADAWPHMDEALQKRTLEKLRAGKK